ncbi:RNA polymerase sigma factor RpoH [Buchnera aphidicola]
MHNIQFLKTLSLKDLSSYIYTVNSWKLLSHDEERILIKKVYYKSDYEAAKMVILSNLKFVIHIARHYSGYGLSQSDIIQEGNLGLMKALRRFNPNIKVRLISFAVYWIKSEIHDYILRNWRIVKVATNKVQRKLFFNLRKIKKKLGWCNSDELEIIARELGVTSRDVQDMEKKIFVRDIHLHKEDKQYQFFPVSNNIISFLTDVKSDFALKFENKNWNKYQINKLHNAILNLDERSRDIIKQRWLNKNNKVTLQNIANIYGISAERVRQLEKIAIMKLKKEII